MALHLQPQASAAVTAPLSPLAASTAGLRRPFNRLALGSSFLPPSLNLPFPSPFLPPLEKQRRRTASAPRPKFSMRVASKQAYICRDCGYIYNDRTPFEKLQDGYFCPVCGAPKRRFKPYTPAVSKNANEKDVRKARKAQLQQDEAIGRALPIAIVVGLAALAGLYLYINSSF